MGNNGQQWTTIDNKGQQWATIDNNGQQWATIRSNGIGQQWTTIRGATCICDAVFSEATNKYILITRN